MLSILSNRIAISKFKKFYQRNINIPNDDIILIPCQLNVVELLIKLLHVLLKDHLRLYIQMESLTHPVRFRF